MNKIRHVGFTGTREGMTEYQKAALRMAMLAAGLDNVTNILHHGDCVGADAEAHDIAVELGWGIVIHPPIDERYRAFKDDGATILPQKDYVPRDHDIVEATRFIFAAPKKDQEERRSGTWLTVRYARKTGKRIILLKRNEQGIVVDESNHL